MIFMHPSSHEGANSKGMKRFISFVLVAMLSLAIVVGCGASQSEDALVLGYSSWPGWWPWAIAQKEGFFAANGLNVQLKWFDNYTESLEALAEGTIDANCQTLNDTISFAPNAVNGESVVLVNDNSVGNDKIVADQSISSLWHLRRKKVAVEVGVVDDFLLTLALNKVGLARHDVDIVNLDTASATAAFVAGKVDAVGAFTPFVDEALARDNSHELISSEAFPGAIPDLLVVSQQLADKSPKQVQALVKTWFDVLDFMAKNPDRSNVILAERAGVSITDLKRYEAGIKFFSLQDNLAAFTPGNEMEHLDFAINEMSRFLVRNNLASEVSGTGILNDRFVEKL
jgi:NitT/TauT family transport system substrate-binding protein